MNLARPLLAAGLLALSAYGFADWELDSDASSVSFVSVKNAAVAESHYFTGLTGRVSKAGNATLALNMTAFETLIPIRNERMVEHLFESARFPLATFTVDVPIAELLKMKRGASAQRDLSGTLALHGATADLTATVIVTRVGKNAFAVASQRPVIVSAAQFNLAGGLETLREIAGLVSIAPSVPVSFSLVFRR